MKNFILTAALAVASVGAYAADYFVVVPVQNKTSAAKVSLNDYVLPSAAVGSAYPGFDFKSVLQVTNDANYNASYARWALTGGALPTGMVLNETTGVLSGTPTVQGVYPLTLQVTYKAVAATRDYAVNAVLVVGELTAATDANFGDVTTGSAASRVFAFRNASTVAATNVAARVVGTGLAIGANTCGTPGSPVAIPGNGGCTYQVTWSPTSAGELANATTSVTSAASNSPSTIALAGTAKPVDADPYWANVVLLMHGDGVEGSTTFTDSSVTAQAWSINGTGTVATPAISAALPKFGTGSIYLPGTAKNLKSNKTLALGRGDFTVEFWAYKTIELGRPQEFLKANGGFYIGGNQPGYYSNGWKLQPTEYCASAGINCGAYSRFLPANAAASVLNAWQHIAYTRANSTFRVYVNGVLTNTVTDTWNMDYTGDLAFTLGSSTWQGYVDELRITKGIARYTGASFQLQTKEHPGY